MRRGTVATIVHSQEVSRMEDEVTLRRAPQRGLRQIAAYVFVPNRGGTVAVIDTLTGCPFPAIAVGAEPAGIAATPDGRRIYVTNAGADSVTVVDVSTRSVLATIPVDRAPRGVAVTPNGERVYVANTESDSLVLIDAATNTIISSSIFAGPTPWALAITPDGRKAYVTNALANRVSVLNLENHTVEAIIRTGTLPSKVAISPDGRHAYVTNASSNTVTPIDVSTDTPGPSIRVGAQPDGVAVTPDGRAVYVASADAKTVSVIDVRTHTVAETVSVHPKPVGVGITPNSQFAYVANADANTIIQIDLATRTIGRQPVSVGTEPLAVGIGPQIIVAGEPSSPPLTIASDEELDALGFTRFLPFNGGALRLSGPWSTTRHISLLAEGGWIDTNGFDAAVYGDVLNDGSLTKTGAGTLALYGRNMHRRDTFVLEGTLIVDDQHDAPIYVDGGTLRGSGQLGPIWATAGVISPGGKRPGTIESTQVTMGAGVSFVTELRGPVAGTDYSQLVVNGTATLKDATLVVRVPETLRPGTSCRILTNVRGTFANLPEGADFLVDGQRLHITYTGGSGSDVVLTVLDEHSTAPRVIDDRTHANGAAPPDWTVLDGDS